MDRFWRATGAQQMISAVQSAEGSWVVLMPSSCYCVALSSGEETGAGHPWLTVDLVVTLQSNKVPVVQPSHAVHPLTPLITYSDEHFSPGSHPSHIPSDVNSKQGESPVFPGLFQWGRSCVSSGRPYRCLCSMLLGGSKYIYRRRIIYLIAIFYKPVRICFSFFNFSG